METIAGALSGSIPDIIGTAGSVVQTFGGLLLIVLALGGAAYLLTRILSGRG